MMDLQSPVITCTAVIGKFLRYSGKLVKFTYFKIAYKISPSKTAVWLIAQRTSG